LNGSFSSDIFEVNDPFKIGLVTKGLAMSSAQEIEEFRINIPQADLDDLAEGSTGVPRRSA
jgi:hypothetical protein